MSSFHKYCRIMSCYVYLNICACVFLSSTFILHRQYLEGCYGDFFILHRQYLEGCYGDFKGGLMGPIEDQFKSQSIQIKVSFSGGGAVPWRHLFKLLSSFSLIVISSKSS